MKYRQRPGKKGGAEPEMDRFITVIYDMTNVDPENREKINHQLNEIYSRNVLDKNNPIDSFLILHVLSSEKGNISKVLTSTEFNFQEVSPESDKFKMIMGSKGSNAIITSPSQVVPGSIPSPSVSSTSAITPVAAVTLPTQEASTNQEKQLSSKESMEERLKNIKNPQNYAGRDGLNLFKLKTYEELSGEYNKLIDNLPDKYKEPIKKWIPMFDCNKIYNIPNVDIFEDFKGFDYENPKKSFEKIRDSIKEKNEIFDKQNKEYIERFTKLSKEKYGFFTLRKSSQKKELLEVADNIKNTIMEPSKPTKVETNEMNYIKDNTNSTIYRIQNEACAYLSQYIMILLIKFNNDEISSYMTANQYNSSDLTKAQAISKKIFDRKRNKLADFFTGSVDSAYMKTLNYYQTMLGNMYALINNLIVLHSMLYDRYNRIYTHVWNEELRDMSIDKIKLGGHITDNNTQGRFPYRERQYTPLITARKSKKRAEKK